MRAPGLADHFADLPTQHHAARLGMWVFLASELLLFSGLFAIWGAYHARYTEAFVRAASVNTIVLGSTNTFVLIISSFVVALAVWAMRSDRPRLAFRGVVITASCGLGFLAIKGIEYADHIEHGLLPGAWFRSDELHGHGAVVFYTLYWFATGLHALHVTAGVAVLAWIAMRIRRGEIDAVNPIALELGAMYWHLVDIVWLFLWPLLYLVG